MKAVGAALSIALLAAGLAVTSVRLASQGSQARPAPAFEVASVRENRTVNSRMLMDGSGGRYTVTNAPLRLLILNAYELQDAQLAGGPGWINETRYDIVGVRGNAPFDQVPAMMRALLVDRFALRTHTERREMAMYGLVTARADRQLGAKLKPANCEGRPFPPQAGQLPCNTRFLGPGGIRASGLTMKDLAVLLTTLVNRIVIDQTGVMGRFDFDLTWTPEQVPPDRPPTDFLPPPDSSGVSIFTALQEQLGLKLDGQRGPVEVLVIDGIERPSEN